MAKFDDTFRTAYGFDAPSIDLGTAMNDGAPVASLRVRIPLAMMNRHGLIAGSTGTGKTRTLISRIEFLLDQMGRAFAADHGGTLRGPRSSRASMCHPSRSNDPKNRGAQRSTRFPSER